MRTSATMPRKTVLRAALLLAALLLVLPAPGARAQPEVGRLSTVTVPEGWRVRDVELGDLDGDGRDDLVVMARERGRDYARQLRVHLRQDGDVAFSPRPDRVLDLTRDVVAFALVDATPAPGMEVLLFTASGAYAWRHDQGEEDLPARVLEADLLWQVPDPDEVFCYRDAGRDLDGDGRTDLLLAEPGGYFAARRGAAGFEPGQRLVLPLAGPDTDPGARGALRLERRAGMRRFSVSLNLSDREGGDLLAVADAVPGPVVADFDGDKRPDVLAQSGEELLVWRQDPEQGFSAAPDQRLVLPLEVDRGRRLDVSFATHAADLDGDGRVDCVILAGDQRSREVRTQVLVYRQANGSPLFGKEGRPDQVLLVGGFAGSAELRDVDGNGLPDLILGSLEVDGLDQLLAAGGGDLTGHLLVYLNEGGRFGRQPGFSVEIPIPAGDLRSAGKEISAVFPGDVTGNGVFDLLLRDRPDRVLLLGLRRTRDGLEKGPRPLFETPVDKNARIRVVPGRPPELLIQERERVLHVRFR